MELVPTIAIVSWKDPTQRWLINESDFNPAVHIRWEDRAQGDPHEEQQETQGAREEKPQQEKSILTAPRRGRPPKS